jgi:hypothetical protein
MEGSTRAFFNHCIGVARRSLMVSTRVKVPVIFRCYYDGHMNDRTTVFYDSDGGADFGRCMVPFDVLNVSRRFQLAGRQQPCGLFQLSSLPGSL